MVTPLEYLDDVLKAGVFLYIYLSLEHPCEIVVRSTAETAARAYRNFDSASEASDVLEQAVTLINDTLTIKTATNNLFDVGLPNYRVVFDIGKLDDVRVIKQYSRGTCEAKFEMRCDRVTAHTDFYFGYTYPIGTEGELVVHDIEHACARHFMRRDVSTDKLC